MSIEIQAGKRYVMRYGGITGPMQLRTGKAYPWGDGHLSWAFDGHWFDNGHDNPGDIIAEYTPQPEPLPFELKAGERYELDNGEVVAPYTTQWTSKGLRAHFPLQFGSSRGIFYVTAEGACIHDTTVEVRRIVRQHIEPKLPTPIERLEKWRSQYGVPSAAVPDLDAIIADLKAEVKP